MAFFGDYLISRFSGLLRVQLLDKEVPDKF